MFKSRLFSSSFLSLAALSAPAFAEGEAPGGMCGQPAALTQPLPAAIGPGFEEMTLITRPLRSEPAYVEFELTEATEMTLQTIGRGADTALALYDAEGRMVTWDDDSAGDLDAQIGAALEPGRYCAQMRILGSEPVAQAMVILLASPGLPPDPEAEAQQAIVDACFDPATPVLAEGLTGGEVQSLSATIDPNLGSQSWRVGVATPLSLRIDATSPEIDTLLTLRDSSGAVVQENDDHPEMAGTDSRVEADFGPGDYCVSVAPYSGGGGSVTVALTASGAPEPEALRIPEAGDGVSVEELGALDGPLESRTLDRERTLWVAFEVDAAGPVTVEGISVTSTFTLRLFGADGAMLQEMRGEGTLASAEMAADLAPGRYLVALVNDDASDGLKMRQVKIRR